MNRLRRVTGAVLMLMTVTLLSVSAFAADYSFEGVADTEYYHLDCFGADFITLLNECRSSCCARCVPEPII